ncbi:Ig-like domain-containing protein [Clostridium tagluense]|uniref:Ig-like domain-containing protein n=1 Tax=Clostridium tagluense TaxID=360422 RepID=UPI001C0BF5A1|nr:Ig-like domain-containing protein [Clostridium tagluense]MBU3127147.1 Ig-like domain-containing protein [Clostridium tagluense]
MGKFKKRLSSVLGILFIAMTFLGYVPAKAAEAITEVAFLGVEHSPLVEGDSETFYLSATGVEKVQYRIFQNKIGSDKWEELTPNYTNAGNANDVTKVAGSAKYKVGKYKLSIWVKKADTEGKFKNKNGGYDSYYIAYLNCVNKDNNNRVYTNGDMNIEKDNYVVGETIKVNGIKDISGMKDPYTYKLHVYDVNNNAWKLDNVDYRKEISFLADKPGTYVLDVWAMSSNSTLWGKEAKLNGRMYEAWKLKVITVTEKKVQPEITEINIKENGVIYGSKDVKNPMEINKKINITANDVVLNNANVRGAVTIPGNNATLNNVKVEGTLILNPGEKGTVKLDNVTADNIEVLSGAANSIHFNNVTVKTLKVNSTNTKESVRIEIKGKTSIEKTEVKSSVILDAAEGSFGNIEVLENQNKTESLIELRGSFDKNIIVKTKATLKTAKDTKILKVVIEPENNEKITLDGNFGQVEVNKKAVVATTENTKIEKITTNSPVVLELGKGSTVTTLDQNGQTVTQTGLGTVEKKVNPAKPTPPSTGGGSDSKPTYKVAGVSLNKTSSELAIGDILELTATINPSNATNKNVTWTSSDSLVAKVTSNAGEKVGIKAIGVGTATITVTTEDGRKTAACIIKVAKVPAPTYAVTGVSLDKTTASITSGQAIELTATINPENATNKNVTWTSSNPLVAKVTSGAGVKANVKATGVGTATITVTTEDGRKTATCTIKVADVPVPVTGVSLNKTTADLKVAEELKLTAIINPENATNKNVTWSSSNPLVAKVTGSTEAMADIKAIGVGTATITVTTEDGGKTATCVINVAKVPAPTYAVTGVSLDKTTASITSGQSIELIATINPENATNKKVTWKSSNEAVATVTGSTQAKANVSAIGAGTAIITVTTEDGGKIATCAITVETTTSPAIELNAVVKIEQKKVTVSVDNIKALNQQITIAIYKENKDIAFIDQLTADVAGKAAFNTILEAGKYHGLVKASNASLSTKLDFEIVQTGISIKVEGVTLNKTTASATTGQSIELIATINPDNATNKNVTWSSSNEAVAKVTSSIGAMADIKAIGAGTAIITVTTEDGGKMATCAIEVTTTTSPAIELNAVVKIEQKKVTVSVDNIKALNQQITIAIYKENKDIAFIDQLTADVAGKAAFNTILEAGKYHGLVKAFQASLSTKLDFEIVQTAVSINVEGVSLNKTTASVTTGQSIELVATVNPDNATNKNVTWTSSNPLVATVIATTQAKANVSAIEAGTAIVTVTTAEGKKMASCVITVTATTTAAIDFNTNAMVEVVSSDKKTSSLPKAGNSVRVDTVNFYKPIVKLDDLLKLVATIQ